jgi:hypothetical protein
MHTDDDDDEDLAALFHESGNVRDQEPGIGSNSGLEPDEALEELDLEDLLKEGRKLLLQDLIKAVKQGMATPAEKNALRQMLKDNGMVMGDPSEGAGNGEPRKKADLPSFPRPEYD